MVKFEVYDKNGKKHEVESIISDEQAVEILKQRAQGGDSFASSLVEKSRDRFGWEPRFQAWGHIIAMREMQRREERLPKKTGALGFAKVVGLMDNAVKNGIEFPRVQMETHDGITVVLHRAGDRSRVAGQVSVCGEGKFATRAYYGKVTREGEWVRSSDCTDSIEALVREIANDPAKIGGFIGRRTGVCCFCRRSLESAASVKVGYGPICADRFGLPWNEESKDE